MRTSHVLLLLAATFSVSGCPNKTNQVPEVMGLLTENGIPAGGVQVRFSVLQEPEHNEPPKETLTIETTTAINGSFSFERSEKWMFVPPVPVDYSYLWETCFEAPGSDPVCGLYRTPGRPGAPDFIYMKCDLENEQLCEISFLRP